jgi:hypothetical protein
MEDATLAYGLLPVGPTDLAQLMMIEYDSSYGNDWYVVPLTLPIGSLTRIDSFPYQAKAGCATSAGSRRMRLAPPSMVPALSWS